MSPPNRHHAVPGPAERARPQPATAAELRAIRQLLHDLAPVSVTIGSATDPASRATADAIAAACADDGLVVLGIISWPENAASWLRQARRFTTPEPDAWVVAARPAGWAGLLRRLARTSWAPERTVVTSALAGPGLPRGLRGTHADGRTWAVTPSGVTTFERSGT